MSVRKHVLHATCALLLALGATSDWRAAAQPPQPLFLGTTTQLTTNAASQTDPAISGSIVVWTDQRNGNDDIYFCNVTNCAATEQQVTSATGAQRLNDVSGTLIAYTDVDGIGRTVRIFNIATGVTTIVAGPARDQNPRLDGQIVAFERGPSSNPDVYAVNLATGVETAVAATTDLDLNPVVGDGRVVFERHATGASPGDIVMYDLATGQVTELEAGPADARRPDIDGDIVVWDVVAGTELDIVVHNLATGITTQVAYPGNQRGPHVSGDVVSFDDDSAGNPNVGLYHIPTGRFELVATAATSEFLSDISGNRVVYTSNASGNLDIYMFEFELQLPEIAVAPLTHDFGDLATGSSETTVVTISNVGAEPLTLTDITMGPGSSAAFDILSGPALPAVVPPDGTADVSVRFTPIANGVVSATLDITSNDLDEGFVQVALSGAGVPQAPPPSEQIADLLAFFDTAVGAGTLRGAGSGNSAGGRLNALRNMIAGAADLIDRGMVAEACSQLLEAYRRADGEPQPPEFVAGPARAELAQRIQAMRAILGCF